MFVAKKCLINECSGMARIRGLCHNCYQNANRMVRSEEITWKELEDGGFALPPMKAKDTSVFKIAVRQVSAQVPCVGVTNER